MSLLMVYHGCPGREQTSLYLMINASDVDVSMHAQAGEDIVAVCLKGPAGTATLGILSQSYGPIAND